MKLDARRYDFAGGLLRPPHRRDTDGAMLCEAVVCREQVLEYKQADGKIRRELVTREAVDSMAKSIGRCAVTLEHPPEFVTAENFDKYGVGDVDGEVEVVEDAQGSFVRVKTAVRRADAVRSLRSGKLPDVSPGYTVVLDETPGEHPTFGRYDAKQIGREANHLALTARGRGTDVPIRADSLDAVQVSEPLVGHTTTITKEPKMGLNPKLAALAGSLGLALRSDSDDTVIDAIATAVMKKMKDAEQDKKDAETAKAELEAAPKQDAVDALQAKLDATTAERDTLKTKLDTVEAEAKAKADSAELEGLKEVATKLKIKLDSDDLTTVRRTIAASRIDSAIDDDTPEAYVLALVDVAKAAAKSVKADPDKRGDSGRDKRYDGLRGNGRSDSGGKSETNPSDDPFYNADLARADSALDSTVMQEA